MQTVTSNDRTEIAYEMYGEGPPIVLVHGSGETRQAWNPLYPHLTDRFTVVVPDRRGRGKSGDADAYSLDREVADLCTLLDIFDDDPAVFGHSFGGLIALEAAQESSLDQLVLYEPALQTSNDANDLPARMQKRIDNGEREAAMELFYREEAGLPAPTQLPIWPDRIHFDLAETVVRELRAVQASDHGSSVDIDCSTLLLTGEQSPDHLRSSINTLQPTLGQCVELDAVGHVGTQTAPERVANTIQTDS
ncbi:alpha/beta fold hydrolase (plasmid) [Natrialba aegyptia]|uniref:Hydrolase or acyltransferase of alpha/beta superfamily protein n=3 Tax=Natrialba aegyptia TaxID=129789 RepID=M0ASV6_9EURY|nr:alpha/beta hydrolase [Natrialba aegyptia]ELZ01417.1 hydrolase or acyltransferase of alpha/beta superfamily protein [Natrialba aegyptia DSM 13077]